MNKTAITAALAALALAGACSKKKTESKTESPSPTPSGSATELPAPAATTAPPSAPGAKLPLPTIDAALFKKPVAISFEGHSIEIKGGHAYGGFNGGMILELFDEPVTCETQASDKAQSIKVQLAAGPGQKFLTGHVIEVDLDAASEALKVQETLPALLHVESVDNKLNGRMKGTVSFDAKVPADDNKTKDDKGGGTFDVPVCNPSAPYAVPETVSGDVKGQSNNKPFAAKKALAYLVPNYYGDPTVQHVYSIMFYEDAAVTCETSNKTFGVGILLNELTLTTKTAAVGSPQQVKGTNGNGGGQGTLSATAWAQFDSADVKPGGEIKGSLYVSSDPDQKEYFSQFGGSFTATICKL